MSTVRRCDICGNVFTVGFCVDVSMSAATDFVDTGLYRYNAAEIEKHKFELGKKDVCIDCYYKMKEALNNKEEQL